MNRFKDTKLEQEVHVCVRLLFGEPLWENNMLSGGGKANRMGCGISF